MEGVSGSPICALSWVQKQSKEAPESCEITSEFHINNVVGKNIVLFMKECLDLSQTYIKRFLKQLAFSRKSF